MKSSVTAGNIGNDDTITISNIGTSSTITSGNVNGSIITCNVGDNFITTGNYCNDRIPTTGNYCFDRIPTSGNSYIGKTSSIDNDCTGNVPPPSPPPFPVNYHPTASPLPLHSSPSLTPDYHRSITSPGADRHSNTSGGSDDSCTGVVMSDESPPPLPSYSPPSPSPQLYHHQSPPLPDSPSLSLNSPNPKHNSSLFHQCSPQLHSSSPLYHHSPVLHSPPVKRYHNVISITTFSETSSPVASKLTSKTGLTREKVAPEVDRTSINNRSENSLIVSQSDDYLCNRNNSEAFATISEICGIYPHYEGNVTSMATNFTSGNILINSLPTIPSTDSTCQPPLIEGNLPVIPPPYFARLPQASPFLLSQTGTNLPSTNDVQLMQSTQTNSNLNKSPIVSTSLSTNLPPPSLIPLNKPDLTVNLERNSSSVGGISRNMKQGFKCTENLSERIVNIGESREVFEGFGYSMEHVLNPEHSVKNVLNPQEGMLPLRNSREVISNPGDSRENPGDSRETIINPGDIPNARVYRSLARNLLDNWATDCQDACGQAGNSDTAGVHVARHNILSHNVHIDKDGQVDDVGIGMDVSIESIALCKDVQIDVELNVVENNKDVELEAKIVNRDDTPILDVAASSRGQFRTVTDCVAATRDAVVSETDATDNYQSEVFTNEQSEAICNKLSKSNANEGPDAICNEGPRKICNERSITVCNEAPEEICTEKLKAICNEKTKPICNERSEAICSEQSASTCLESPHKYQDSGHGIEDGLMLGNIGFEAADVRGDRNANVSDADNEIDGDCNSNVSDADNEIDGDCDANVSDAYNEITGDCDANVSDAANEINGNCDANVSDADNEINGDCDTNDSNDCDYIISDGHQKVTDGGDGDTNESDGDDESNSESECAMGAKFRPPSATNLIRFTSGLYLDMDSQENDCTATGNTTSSVDVNNDSFESKHSTLVDLLNSSITDLCCQPFATDVSSVADTSDAEHEVQQRLLHEQATADSHINRNNSIVVAANNISDNKTQPTETTATVGTDPITTSSECHQQQLRSNGCFCCCCCHHHRRCCSSGDQRTETNALQHNQHIPYNEHQQVQQSEYPDVQRQQQPDQNHNFNYYQPGQLHESSHQQQPIQQQQHDQMQKSNHHQQSNQHEQSNQQYCSQLQPPDRRVSTAVAAGPPATAGPPAAAGRGKDARSAAAATQDAGVNTSEEELAGHRGRARHQGKEVGPVIRAKR